MGTNVVTQWKSIKHPLMINVPSASFDVTEHRSFKRWETGDLTFHLASSSSQQSCSCNTREDCMCPFSLSHTELSTHSWAIHVTKPRVSVQSLKTGLASSVSAWPCDFLLLLQFIWLQQSTHASLPRSDSGCGRALTEIPRRLKPARLSHSFLSRDIWGSLKEEDAETKAFKRLGEGAGAEEEGERSFLGGYL